MKISHNDRARAWCKRSDRVAQSPRRWNAEYDIKSLAAEFEALLPEGSVAVDREKLRSYLEFRNGNALYCRHNSCTFIFYPRGEGLPCPHSPDCPLGDDDAE